jgi:hypothetical protein
MNENISIRNDRLPKMGQRETATNFQIFQPLLCELSQKRIEIEKSATQKIKSKHKEDTQ